MKRKICIYLHILFLCGVLNAQIKLIVNKLPKNTPENVELYVASSINGWNPKDSKMRMQKTAAGIYEITISKELIASANKMEYKFTQGSWDLVEGGPSGEDFPNRSILISGLFQSKEHQINSWKNTAKKIHTASKNVKILSENFEIPELKTKRKIWIYLPENYSNSKRKYPVIYMEDAQNIFDNATSFSGEWKVDEALDEFHREGKPEAIIVGIENNAIERLNEYAPWNNKKYGGGKGDLYADFIANQLKPYMDHNFRTLPQAKHTGVIGSSMGGLISFYIGMKYPQKFGKMGIFSPSFWFAKEDLKKFIHLNSTKIKHSKIYFLAGAHESEDMVPDLMEIKDLLIKKGICKKNIYVKIDEDGTHSESYWAREFPAAYLWLLR